MNQGPLNEEELEWLDDTLTQYGNDDSVLDVSELDGMLTAILSAPTMITLADWQAAVWGGEKQLPHWESAQEQQRFYDLCSQHMNDIAERLCHAPDQFDPLFGYREVDGNDYTIVEEWCFGYMRGVALSDWSTLPETLRTVLEAIALHGEEANIAKLEQMTEEEYETSQAAIGPAALELHRYWKAQPQSETKTVH
ncbi:YecA family protein [Buttiauxella selenatireducens]|uniref:YecA family protein n=1 Tax=Buttiauxella selenatireducens TaxID=3073902 RepID=A0ABY9SF99_9ENTR|nr:YecA family protein [Buttiauxella sp. R73]WMY76107.1 YecA family protein [Buttiauxella sp. R73]